MSHAIIFVMTSSIHVMSYCHFEYSQNLAQEKLLVSQVIISCSSDSCDQPNYLGELEIVTDDLEKYM